MHEDLELVEDDVLLFQQQLFPISSSHIGVDRPDPAEYSVFSACKAGDLDRVRALVELHDVDVNRKDEFDSIPLFYACLCGHTHIVKYLLDKGAKLDAKTFEGARCFVRKFFYKGNFFKCCCSMLHWMTK
jgi:hypothetical protein